MLQQDLAEDYVIASGEQHSVREFVECSADVAGFSLVWEGVGVDERGVDRRSGNVIVQVDPRYFRPVDNSYRVGDAAKAAARLGWSPAVRFDELVRLMTEAEFQLDRSA
jgi:GDPmannose 4,6-dehydratase